MNAAPSPPAALPPALAQAMRLHQAGDVAGALALYEALLAQAPQGDATLHNFAGTALIQLRRFDEGEAQVRRALALDPSYAEAWNALGNLCRLAGRPEAALEAYTAVTRLAPAVPGGWINLADLHRQMGQPARAREALAAAVRCAEADAGGAPAYRRQLLQHLAALHGAWGLWDEAAWLLGLALGAGAPDDARMRRERIHALLQARRRDEARLEAQAWLARQPADADAQQALAAADAAHTPERAGDAAVSALFDSHARSFDAQLAALGYRAPALLAHVVAQRLGAPRADGPPALDAGCGTGLCGPWLRERTSELHGMDLSQGMLDLARERGLYDRLERAELTAFLQAHTARYGLIVAADVLCYFGALEAFSQGAHGALRPGGLLAFTVEHDEEPEGEASGAAAPGYRLQLSGRYRHTEPYVRRCLQQAGFAAIVIAGAELRQEAGAPVAGLVVTAGAARTASA